MTQPSGLELGVSAPSEIIAGVERLNTSWSLRYATIKTVLSAASAIGTYSGDDLNEIPFISLVGQLVVGQRVAALFIPPSGNYVISVTGPGGDAVPAFNTNTDVNTTTSAAYTTAGATLTGVVFVAPSTGRVLIHWAVEAANSAGSFTLVSPQVATGDTVGAGTVVLAASDDNTARADTTAVVRSANFHPLSTGLTAGTVYNCALYHRVGAGTGTISRRRVLVLPA